MQPNTKIRRKNGRKGYEPRHRKIRRDLRKPVTADEITQAVIKGMAWA